MGSSSSLITEIFILIILVGINAFFASSEIGIISLSDRKIKKMADEGHKKAKLLQNLISEPSRFLATIQVGVTLSALMASAFASQSFADRLSKFAVKAGIHFDDSIIKIGSVIVVTIFLSYFTLVFGELVPKRIAMQHPEAISMFSIKPLHFLLRIANPFVRVLTFSTNSIIRLFGGNPTAIDESVTEEEIRMMVDLGEERGVIEEAEKEMIEKVFEFNNTLTSEIMTHRTDIMAVSIDTGLKELMDVVIMEKYTRIPVYSHNIDNIVGILYVKDLLQFTVNDSRGSFCLKDIVRKPYFVPHFKKTDDLFKELQKNKTHMAVVIDEYGGTAGIVTLEDLVEEVFGSILDEYDEEVKDIEKIDENTFVINGTVPLDSVRECLEMELPVEEYETLSGFVIGQLGRIPAEGEKPEIEFNGMVFKVEKVEGKWISMVKACRV